MSARGPRHRAHSRRVKLGLGEPFQVSADRSEVHYSDPLSGAHPPTVGLFYSLLWQYLGRLSAWPSAQMGRLDWRVSDVLCLWQALASSCNVSEGFPGLAEGWPVGAGASNNNSGLGGGL